MTMPALQSILDTALASFEDVVEQDTDATMLRNLLEVVQEVTKFVAVLGLAMIQRYVDVRLRQTKATHRVCECGEPMEWLANSAWSHGTQFGDVRVKDTYAYCRKCRRSARPLHGRLGTGVERWSLSLEEKIVDLASDESCGKAVAKLARQHPGADVGRTSALRMLHRHGAEACEFIEKKLAAALESVAQEGQREGVKELEIEYDGGMIPVATLEPIPTPEGQEPELTPVRRLPKRHKNCRWEEAKLGLVQIPGEVEGRLYTVRPTAELDEAFRDLLGLARIKGWSEQTHVRGIADGARHIRPRMADAFNGSPFKFILDRPHAKEHLTAAGEELEKLGGEPKADWAAAAIEMLEKGHAGTVIAELRQAAERSNNEPLRREAAYFARNRDAVAYADYRARGWSTASSEVESGHRSIVQVRLKLSGAWWDPEKVKNILALRMLKANNWWAEYWQYRRQRWRECADELRNTEPRTRLATAA